MMTEGGPPALASSPAAGVGAAGLIARGGTRVSIDESLDEGLGDIKINNEVVSTVASLAAVEVDGVVSLAGKTSLAEMWGQKDLTKGVTVEIGKDNAAVVHIEANVEYGAEIYKCAHQVQRSVKDAVERMTGLRVTRVNVTIRGIVMGDDPRRPRAVIEPAIEPMNGTE